MKNKEEIKVNCCGSCPFQEVSYDDFAVGNDTIEVCLLARKLNMKEYFIDVYDSKRGEDSGNLETKVPEWCPLKEKDYTISLNG